MKALEGRAIFVGNNFDTERNLEIHREKLKNMRKVVDNTAPTAVCIRATSPSKGRQNSPREVRNITRANLLLAKRIFDIMEGKSMVTKSIERVKNTDNHPGTLNFRYRLNEAQRIHDRNMLLASRLDTVLPHYRKTDLTVFMPIKKHNPRPKTAAAKKKSRFARELEEVLGISDGKAGSRGNGKHGVGKGSRSARKGGRDKPGSRIYDRRHRFDNETSDTGNGNSRGSGRGGPGGGTPFSSRLLSGRDALSANDRDGGGGGNVEGEGQKARPQNLLLEYTKIQEGRVLDIAVLKEPFRDRYAIFGIDIDDGQRYELRLSSEDVSNTLDGDILVTSVDNVEVWMALLNKVVLHKVDAFTKLPISAADDVNGLPNSRANSNKSEFTSNAPSSRATASSECERGSPSLSSRTTSNNSNNYNSHNNNKSDSSRNTNSGDSNASTSVQQRPSRDEIQSYLAEAGMYQKWGGSSSSYDGAGDAPDRRGRQQPRDVIRGREEPDDDGFVPTRPVGERPSTRSLGAAGSRPHSQRSRGGGSRGGGDTVGDPQSEGTYRRGSKPAGQVGSRSASGAAGVGWYAPDMDRAEGEAMIMSAASADSGDHGLAHRSTGAQGSQQGSRPVGVRPAVSFDDRTDSLSETVRVVAAPPDDYSSNYDYDYYSNDIMNKNSSNDSAKAGGDIGRDSGFENRKNGVSARQELEFPIVSSSEQAAGEGKGLSGIAAAKSAAPPTEPCNPKQSPRISNGFEGVAGSKGRKSVPKPAPPSMKSTSGSPRPGLVRRTSGGSGKASAGGGGSGGGSSSSKRGSSGSSASTPVAAPATASLSSSDSIASEQEQVEELKGSQEGSQRGNSDLGLQKDTEGITAASAPSALSKAMPPRANLTATAIDADKDSLHNDSSRQSREVETKKGEEEGKRDQERKDSRGQDEEGKKQEEEDMEHMIAGGQLDRDVYEGMVRSTAEEAMHRALENTSRSLSNSVLILNVDAVDGDEDGDDRGHRVSLRRFNVPPSQHRPGADRSTERGTEKEGGHNGGLGREIGGTEILEAGLNSSSIATEEEPSASHASATHGYGRTAAHVRDDGGSSGCNGSGEKVGEEGEIPEDLPEYLTEEVPEEIEG